MAKVLVLPRPLTYWSNLRKTSSDPALINQTGVAGQGWVYLTPFPQHPLASGDPLNKGR